MNYWLVKSEPAAYSWQQFVKDGRTMWDGVRNYQTRLSVMPLTKETFDIIVSLGDTRQGSLKQSK